MVKLKSLLFAGSMHTYFLCGGRAAFLYPLNPGRPWSNETNKINLIFMLIELSYFLLKTCIMSDVDYLFGKMFLFEFLNTQGEE